jgi:hypothetical protein
MIPLVEISYMMCYIWWSSVVEHGGIIRLV